MSKNKKKRKELIKRIERHIKKLKNYKVTISNIEKKLDYILPSITSNYEIREGSVGTFSITSTTENCAIDRIESKRALDLLEEKEELQLIIDAVENAIASRNEDEKLFIYYRYERDFTYKAIASEMSCSESHVYRIHRTLMDDFTTSLKCIADLRVREI